MTGAFVRILAASIVMGAAAWATDRMLAGMLPGSAFIAQAARLLVTIASAMAVLAAAAYVLDIRELRQVVALVARRGVRVRQTPRSALDSCRFVRLAQTDSHDPGILAVWRHGIRARAPTPNRQARHHERGGVRRHHPCPRSGAALAQPAEGRARRAWRLVTYMFVHAGFFHLLFNMLAISDIPASGFNGCGAPDTSRPTTSSGITLNLTTVLLSFVPYLGLDQLFLEHRGRVGRGAGHSARLRDGLPPTGRSTCIRVPIRRNAS